MMVQQQQQPWSVSLGQLLLGLVEHEVPDCTIEFVCTDSRAVKPGTLFLATRGIKRHGLEFARQAWASGAVAIAYEPVRGLVPPEVPEGCVCLPVNELGKHAGAIAARFFDDPSAAMKVCGVTGTNGKTTTTHTIAMAMRVLGNRCGQMGTLGFGLNEPLAASQLTTPDAIAVQQRLAWIREQRASHLAMEVSSHALTQHRVSAIHFDCAVFTNLSRDHLDYHGDISQYAAAKRELFEQFPITGAMINIDDEVGRVLAHDCAKQYPVTAFGVDSNELKHFNRHVLIENIKAGRDGISVTFNGSFGSGEIKTSLVGPFNAWNLSAALCVLMHWQVPFDQALSSLQSVQPPAGRMETFGRKNEALIVVDYAHTPDALENALKAVKGHCKGELWCVFGCGGDRDRGKRPMMAQAAGLANHVIVTNDNPRHEDPEQIIQDIMAGFEDIIGVDVVPDREQAIRNAVLKAGPNDVVLIAGKGHEQIQLIGNQRKSFSDRALVAELLSGDRDV